MSTYENKLTEELRLNPKKGIRWTDHFCHVGVVLDFNEHAVIWADKKINEDKDGYEIDYFNPSIISREKYEKITKHCEILRPNKNYAKTYEDYVNNGGIIQVKLPQTREEALILLNKENPPLTEKTPAIGMKTMENPDKPGYKGYYIVMPDGTYVDIELIDGKYEFFIRDKEGREGFYEKV